MKKRGFGQGLWNGSGGKPEENETVEEAAKREVQEELGVKVIKLEKRGEIGFYLRQEEKEVLMHVYLVTKWEGEPTEIEEMRPQWFDVSELPFNQMWQADIEWLILVLSGKSVKAKYTYAHEGGKVEKREIGDI